MSEATRRAVVVMAKRPLPGRAKTRLVPPLTPDLAAELAECFLLDALDLARSVAGAEPLVAIWPPDIWPRRSFSSSSAFSWPESAARLVQ